MVWVLLHPALMLPLPRVGDDGDKSEKSRVKAPEKEKVMNPQVDPFDGLVSLPHEVTFFIPSTVDVDQVDQSIYLNVLKAVSTELASAYGGVTQNAPASGGWVSESVGLVWESVTPVTVYVEELSVEVKSHLVRLARWIKSEMRQEAVLFVVDGKGLLA